MFLYFYISWPEEAVLRRGSWLLASTWREEQEGGRERGRGAGGGGERGGEQGCSNRLVNWAFVGVGPSGAFGGLIII